MTNCPDASDDGASQPPAGLGLFCPCFVDTSRTTNGTEYNCDKRAGGMGTDATIQSADASLVDEDDGHIDPHYARSPPIAIEKVRTDDDDEFSAEDFDDISEVSYTGQQQHEREDEDTLANGLEDAYQRVMTGNDASTKSGGSKKRSFKKRVTSLRRSAGSKLVRSLSFSSSKKHDGGGEDGATANKDGSYDAASISAEIDAILGIERTRTAGPRGEELLIQYVRSDDEEDGNSNDDNNIRSAASFTQSHASQFVPAAAAAAAAAASACAATTTTGTPGSSAPNVPMMRSTSLIPSFDDEEVGEGEHYSHNGGGDPYYKNDVANVPSLEEGFEVDDIRAASTGRDLKERNKSAAVAARLRRSIGSFKRAGSRLTRRVSISSTTSSKHYEHCNDDIEQTLGLVGVSTPDTALFAEEVYSDASSCDTSDSDMSVKGLRRRVVKVESKVQSQIERAMSFDSQNSLALAASSNGGRGQRHEQWQRQQPQKAPPPPLPQQQHSVLLQLGCTGGTFCDQLNTPDGVKKYAGMPLFNDGASYGPDCGVILPSRSVDEKTVAFVDAPPTDPVTSGLVASPSYDSAEEDRDEDNFCGGSGEKGATSTRKGRRRPLAFLRKKTTRSSDVAIVSERQQVIG